MVLAWSQDRVGPICRTIEDCAMVFNAIHGVDPKDPGTVTTPFQFDRKIKLASVRLGVDDNAPKELVDVLKELGAVPAKIGPRPQAAGGGLGAESAAAFDFYVQSKAKELGIDLATLPEPQRGRGAGGRGGGGDPAPGAAGAAPPETPQGGRGGDGGRGRGGEPGRPTGMAAITRWTNGRFPRAFDFINAQRRRYILISDMEKLLKDVDMYVPGGGYDVGLHAQTGHPAAVVPYKFDSPPAGGRGGGPGRGAEAAAAAGAAGAGAGEPAAGRGEAAPAVVYNKQPICAVICGNLYNDDKILSVAHAYQLHTAWHLKHPAI